MGPFKLVIITFASILGVFLAACSSDSGSGANMGEEAEVKTIHSLGECKGANEGVSKFVTSENAYYTCSNGVWETEAPVQPIVEGEMTDERDGQIYRTVKIGNQIWMAENLNYRYLGRTAKLDSSSFCYDNDPANCDRWGRLYLWSAAMDSAGIIKGNLARGCGYNSGCYHGVTVRGVCPQGWHLPDSTEWIVLIDATGGIDVAGTRLKSTTGWSITGWGESGNGTDRFGFSALPAGFVIGDCSECVMQYFMYAGGGAYFWGTSEYGTPYGLQLSFQSGEASLGGLQPRDMKSVRCLKDDDSKFDETSPVIDPSTIIEGEMTDERDGQTYRIVKIGDQVWMAENLNYRYLGHAAGKDSSSFCDDDDPGNCVKYGRLYPWSAVMDNAGFIEGNTANGCGDHSECTSSGPVRGVCPKGWHVPSKSEFVTLFDAVGGGGVAGQMLKSTSGWCDNGNGTDSYSFSVLTLNGEYAEFWSSTEYDKDFAYGVSLSCSADAGLGDDFKGYSRSVRCLKDDGNISSDSKNNPELSSSSIVVEGTMTDERDEQTYRTVKIGDQVWMAENLNYRYLGPTADLDSSSFCYDEDPTYCETYGRLYIWSAAMDSAGIVEGNTANGCGYSSECSLDSTVRGVCPQGWHLPSRTEFKALFDAVGGKDVAGTELKSTSGWERDDGDYRSGNGTDSFRFSALPAGRRHSNGSYDEGDYANFWSSTEYNNYLAYYMYLDYDTGEAYLRDYDKSYGFSVRCLKDK